MQISICGRHFTVTDALKNYVQKKVVRFEKFAIIIIETHVILSVEKYRQCAEISIFGKKLKIAEKSVDTDMYAAIDKVCAKLEKKLSRLKDKMKEHRPQRPIKIEGF